MKPILALFAFTLAASAGPTTNGFHFVTNVLSLGTNRLAEPYAIVTFTTNLVTNWTTVARESRPLQPEPRTTLQMDYDILIQSGQAYATRTATFVWYEAGVSNSHTAVISSNAVGEKLLRREPDWPFKLPRQCQECESQERAKKQP